LVFFTELYSAWHKMPLHLS